MRDHLTETDMQHYAEIHTMTRENLAFVAEVNTHVIGCEMCKEKLDLYCLEEEELYLAPELTPELDERG